MAACGTYAGYLAHKRRGEKCAACSAASAEYSRKRRATPSTRKRNPKPALARQFDCPTCGASAGEYCVTGRISRMPTYAVCLGRLAAYEAAEVG